MYRLLIVDDEKDICENIKYLLDWSLYNITSILTATSYAEAVSKAVDFHCPAGYQPGRPLGL